ncbi:hypothetical protein HanIR_Chr05g0254461 [Helianthus annuus]|nr:hypothetical protein HanIR_Chr05g0254461 [Helianthus annuus]
MHTPSSTLVYGLGFNLITLIFCNRDSNSNSRGPFLQAAFKRNCVYAISITITITFRQI